VLCTSGRSSLSEEGRLGNSFVFAAEAGDGRQQTPAGKSPGRLHSSCSLHEVVYEVLPMPRVVKSEGST